MLGFQVEWQVLRPGPSRQMQGTRKRSAYKARGADLTLRPRGVLSAVAAMTRGLRRSDLILFQRVYAFGKFSPVTARHRDVVGAALAPQLPG